MTTGRTGRPAPSPAPLVGVRQDPVAWVRTKAELLLAAAVLALLGELIVVAVYYLLFEVNPTITHLWHQAVPNSTLRHNIRNVGEGLLGGFLAQQVVWNHYKRPLRHPGWLDLQEARWHIPNLRVGRRLSVPQLLTAPLVALVYAVPGFLLALGVTALARHHQHTLHATLPALFPSLDHAPGVSHGVWPRLQTLWTQNWDKKLMGLGASFVFGRRPMRAVFDDIQLRLVQRRLTRHRPLKRYHPAPFQARYNDLATRLPAEPGTQRDPIATITLTAAVFAAPLALCGLYVLTFVANP